MPQRLEVPVERSRPPGRVIGPGTLFSQSQTVPSTQRTHSQHQHPTAGAPHESHDHSPGPMRMDQQQRQTPPPSRSEKTKAWRAAGREAATGSPAFTERVHITATIHKAREGRWDPNNLWPSVKATVDGIVEAGVLADDDWKHVLGPDMRKGAKGAPRIVLELTVTN